MKRLARNVVVTALAVPLLAVGLVFLFFPSPRKAG